MKKCFRCGHAKALDEFHKDKSRKGGRYPICIECYTVTRKQQYRSNLEYNREYKRRQAFKHRKKNRARGRRWYLANRNRVNERVKLYRARNKKRWSQYHLEWQRRNKPKMRAWHKRWLSTEHGKKVMLHHGRNYRAKIRGATGTHTLEEWEDLKKRFGFRCRMCKKKEPKIRLTRDHIIPISKHGSNFISNIQPLCGPCNSSKHNKIVSHSEVDVFELCGKHIPRPEDRK